LLAHGNCGTALTGCEPKGLVRFSEASLRNFEILAALLLAVILFVGLKVIGLVAKFALIAAALGFVAGLLLARSFRR
jgi:hypothetical protein